MSEQQGTVVRWFHDKRYGFLKFGTRDLFFHGSAIIDDADSDAIAVGDIVSFEEGVHKGRPIANNIRILE
jgi:cold shock CspA family protein